MNVKTTSLVMAVALGLLANNALAQQTTTGESKLYAGLEMGSSSQKDVSGDMNRTLTGQLGGTATSTQDNTITNGRVFGGFNFNENIGLELGYNQTSSYGFKFSGRSGGGVAYAGTASAKMSGLDYSLLLRPNVSTGLNGLFLRIGGHTFDQKTDVYLTSGSVAVRSSETKNGSGLLYGLGYDVKLSNTWDLRLSYTQIDKAAGISGNDGNFVSIGLLAKF